MSVYKLYNAAKCYIGSTEQTMEERLKNHKSDFNIGKEKCVCTSRLILCDPDWDWVVLEDNVPLKQLKIRERYWFDITPDKVNKNLPYATEEEKIEHKRKRDKEYHQKNKEARLEYYQKNKEYFIARNKEYREKDRGAYNARRRENYAKKKLEKQQECVTTS